MTYLISLYWPWLVLLFAVGLIIALVSQRSGDRMLPAAAIAVATIILGVAFAAALADAAPGRLGLFVETAVLSYLAYLAGGAAGALFGGRRPVVHANWWLGFGVLALILILVNLVSYDPIENGIRERAGAALAAEGGDPYGFDVDGRDVMLAADAAPADRREAVAAAIEAVPGVRRVSGVEKLAGPAARARADAVALRTAEDAVKSLNEEKAALAASLAEAKALAATEAASRADLEKAMREAADKAASTRSSIEESLRRATARAGEASAARATLETQMKDAAAKAEAERAALADQLAALRAQADQRSAARDELEAALKQAADRAAAAQASLKAELDAATDKAGRAEAARAALDQALADANRSASARQAALEADLKSAAAKAEREAAARAELEKAAGEARARAAAAAETVATCRRDVAALVAARPILFGRNRMELTDAARGVLDDVGAALAGCPTARLEIAGHADSVGSDVGNLFVSQRRAEAVLDYLAKAGVRLAEIDAVGHSAKEPVAPNDTTDGRARNRRVEFVLR